VRKIRTEVEPRANAVVDAGPVVLFTAPIGLAQSTVPSESNALIDSGNLVGRKEDHEKFCSVAFQDLRSRLPKQIFSLIV